MSSPLRPGAQLASTTCGTRVVVVRVPADSAPTIACGGNAMVDAASAPSSPAGVGQGGTQIGKRYVNADETVELLCSAAGAGALSCDGEPMTIKAAKTLPASD